MRHSFRPLYWLTVPIVFSIILSMIETLEIKDIDPLENSELIEITDSVYHRVFHSEKNTYCVFFYMPNSNLCKKMEENLNKVKRDEFKHIPIYKLNVNDYPSIFYDLNLSGLPLVIIYTNGKEVRRVMGKVSTLNLNLILEREIK